MELTLSDELAAELRDTLSTALGDLHSEIADTDNPAYRQLLRDRRARLEALATLLGPG